MSSKSPVRSCEDCDETALSYAEIKALCAGNPLIAEKMNLDNEVTRLRLLKSEHQSQHYRLEDSVLQHFPTQIASVTERISGIEKDIAIYAAEKAKHTDVAPDGAVMKFPGMTIKGVVYTEKEPAAKAILESCKEVKGSLSELPLGEYMGFKMSLSYEVFGQQFHLLLRGNMTYQVDLGTDALGNITRINNGLEKLPERLVVAKQQLENYKSQAEAAKIELAKPFEMEAELAEKETRLALLNADLNIDGSGDGEFDVMNDTDDRNPSGDGNNEGNDEAEPEEEGDEPELPNYMNSRVMVVGCPPVPERKAGKEKPSILGEIESFDSVKNNPANGDKSKGKQSEHDI